MREILFRGKRVDNGEWVYGDLINTPELKTRIIWYEDTSSDGVDSFKDFNYLVDKNTIGQFTGLLDKNGNKIFEGNNSLKLTIIGLGEGFVDVTIKNGQWFIHSESQGFAPLFEMLNNSAIELEIIGNIHEKK